MEKFIEVNYVCECGNKESVIPDRTRAIYHRCVPIDKYLKVICLECGRGMKLEVTKTTQKLETEIIQEG